MVQMKKRGGNRSNYRRTFLKTLWTVLGITALLELIFVVLSYLSPGQRRDKNATPAAAVITAGAAERFETGSVTAFRQGRFYLTRLDDGGFLALSHQCTHLGCAVAWSKAENQFQCPCHASTFDLTGAVIQAPAPRPLDLFPLYIENGIIQVDTSKRIRRDSFSADQVVYL